VLWHRYYPAPRDAQSPRPRTLASGDEVLVVFLGSPDCAATQRKELRTTMRKLSSMLAARVQAEHTPITRVGVYVAWSARDALRLDEEFGPFDEVSAGSNWLNSGAVEYIWRDESVPPTLPQIVVVRRTITVDVNRIRLKQHEVIARHFGVDEITAWVDAGAPFGRHSPPAKSSVPRS
jgi:hypothetical protein